MNAKRDRTRAAIVKLTEDVASNNAAIAVIRMREDVQYRRRYGRYLRGQMEMREVLQGQTHQQWYESWSAGGRW